jgi:hypothetical protein
MFDAKSEGQSGSENDGSDRFIWAKKVSVSFTPAASATVSGVFQDVTVPGAAVGDMVTVCPPANGTNAVSVAAAYVKAANTVAVRFINPTAGSLTHPAGTFDFLLIRKASGA